METSAKPVIKLDKGYRKYRIKGVDRDIIARKGGPTALQIKTQSTYKELRNNQQEFGAASRIAKSLRNTFSHDLSKICETYSSGKLTAQFRKLAKLEEGPTGQRPIYVTRHGQRLQGFEFNPESPYDKIFGAKYYVKHGSSKDHLILHFPSFTPHETFDYPENATNFKINARLVGLSDFHYNGNTKVYQPVNEPMHGQFDAFDTGMLPILKMPMDSITAQLNLMSNGSLDGLSLFLILAVSFYHFESGQFELLNKDSCMSIKQVY